MKPHCTEPTGTEKHHMRAYEAMAWGATQSALPTGPRAAYNWNRSLRQYETSRSTYNDVKLWRIQMGGKSAYPMVGFPLSDACKIRKHSDFADNFTFTKTQVKTCTLHTVKDILHLQPNTPPGEHNKPASHTDSQVWLPFIQPAARCLSCPEYWLIRESHDIIKCSTHYNLPPTFYRCPDDKTKSIDSEPGQ